MAKFDGPCGFSALDSDSAFRRMGERVDVGARDLLSGLFIGMDARGISGEKTRTFARLGDAVRSSPAVRRARICAGSTRFGVARSLGPEYFHLLRVGQIRSLSLNSMVMA